MKLKIKVTADLNAPIVAKQYKGKVYVEKTERMCLYFIEINFF